MNKETKITGFCKSELAWNFEFVHWTGKKVAVKLVTDVDFSKLSPDTFLKQHRNGATISVYDYNEKPEEEGKPNYQFGVVIPAPADEKRDPHAIFTQEECRRLNASMIREAQTEFIRKFATQWFYTALKESSADKVAMQYVDSLPSLKQPSDGEEAADAPANDKGE